MLLKKNELHEMLENLKAKTPSGLLRCIPCDELGVGVVIIHSVPEQQQAGSGIIKKFEADPTGEMPQGLPAMRREEAERLHKEDIFRKARYYLQMAEITAKEESLHERFMATYRMHEQWILKHKLEEEFAAYMAEKTK